MQIGDSLNTISEKFYNTSDMVPTIQKLNDISNKHKIYAGQEIKLQNHNGLSILVIINIPL
ncbi:hypothetical protein AN1V17_39010 [Vallitalea sediminicola]